jgi:predicted adenine nucleotide alpha hydrolase (AANH) superfamily ATPase
MCINLLREDDHQITLFWYNPNIHPYTEYSSRRDVLINYGKELGLPTVVEDSYGLRQFIKECEGDFNNRCIGCYRMRLSKTAEYAKANGFDGFSTTLLISPYQKHNEIISCAKIAGRENKIEFVYRDFRPYFREGQKKAREMAFYMQKYCGCIFSEEDRYNHNKSEKK